jgi:hypothetical protein
MPVGARILSVAGQRGAPYLWALVETANPPQTRQFLAIGTGQDAAAAEYAGYLGQYQIDDGREVYHVFEIELPSARRSG